MKLVSVFLVLRSLFQNSRRFSNILRNCVITWLQLLETMDFKLAWLVQKNRQCKVLNWKLVEFHWGWSATILGTTSSFRKRIMYRKPFFKFNDTRTNNRILTTLREFPFPCLQLLKIKQMNVVIRPGRVVGNYILSGVFYLGYVKPLSPFRESFQTRARTHFSFGQIDKFCLNYLTIIWT